MIASGIGKRSAFALVLLACLAGSPARAQVLRFDRLTQEEGLSQSFVAAIQQDSYGFIWIGTQDGLNRYDGYEVRRFRPDETPDSLRNGQIRGVALGRDGRLWVATREGGFSLWDPEKETFKTWLREEKGAAKSAGDFDAVNALLANDDGTVWIGTFSGLALFDPKNETFRNVIPKRRISFLTRGPNNSIFAGSGGTLFLVDAGLAVTELKSPSGSITSVVDNQAGGWWAGTSSGALLSWDAGTLAFEPYPDFKIAVPISALLVDKRGILQIGTRGAGVLSLDPRTGHTLSARMDLTDPHSLPSDQVNALFEDRTGILWVGTEAGLARHDPRSEAFRVYRAGPEGLSDNYVWAAQADHEGNLWVGTNAGASRLDRATRTWKSWAPDPANRRSLASDSVAAILIDRGGAVWLGGNRGLSRFDAKTGDFESWRREKDKPDRPGRVFSLLETRDGSILVGTGQGLMLWQPATRTFAFQGGEEFKPAIFNLAEDPDGSIWVGTFFNGLYRLDRSTEVTSRAFPFEPHQICATLVDSQGRLWIGTSQGLFRRDAPGAALRRYQVRDGLPNDTVMGVVEDRQGRLWISTTEGLASLDPRSHAFRSFAARDGLPSNEFNQMATGRTPDGEILLGSANGLLVFDPDAIATDPTPPQVVFTGFEVLNTPAPIGTARHGFALERSILTTEDLQLSHREKVVTFTFAALHFGAPRAARYAYRLEGWDSAWQDEDAGGRSATWTNLAPGNYVLQVKASNKDGVWSEPASLRVHVLPPPWRTWWAYTAYAAFAAAALLLLLSWRTESLRRRQRELEQLVFERTAEVRKANAAKSLFLANMSHELRTPLNAVLGFAQLLERSPSLQGEDRTNLDIIRRAGAHLLGLINDILSLSKIEAGRLTLEKTAFSLRGLLKSVETIMAPAASKAGLSLSLETAPGIPDGVMGDEGKLRQILVNLVGNGVKFTKRGSIKVRTSWSEGRARFEVEDTGSGIAPTEIASLFEPFVQTETGRQSKEGTGLGLIITREIVRLMDGEIQVSSEVGVGSKFSFDVALPAAELQGEAASPRRVIGLAEGQPPLTVLVADDVPDNRLLIVRLLSAVGLRVVEAKDGDEALSAWEQERPDLILMDLRMPVLDGREATKLIRERERQRGLTATPIIALTASAFVHERDEILACGADDFLTKPFSESLLFSAIERRTGARFQTESEESAAANAQPAELTPAHIARLTPTERAGLRDALETGHVSKAVKLAEEIRARDEALGRDLLSEIRAYRIEHLLDMLDE